MFTNSQIEPMPTTASPKMLVLRTLCSYLHGIDGICDGITVLVDFVVEQRCQVPVSERAFHRGLRRAPILQKTDCI